MFSYQSDSINKKKTHYLSGNIYNIQYHAYIFHSREIQQSKYSTANIYFYGSCSGHPNIDVFICWGLSDARIWRIGGGWVDTLDQPKPAYNRIDQLVYHEWKTNLELNVDNMGS